MPFTITVLKILTNILINLFKVFPTLNMRIELIFIAISCILTKYEGFKPLQIKPKIRILQENLFIHFETIFKLIFPYQQNKNEFLTLKKIGKLFLVCIQNRETQ